MKGASASLRYSSSLEPGPNLCIQDPLCKYWPGGFYEVGIDVMKVCANGRSDMENSDRW